MTAKDPHLPRQVGGVEGGRPLSLVAEEEELAQLPSEEVVGEGLLQMEVVAAAAGHPPAEEAAEVGLLPMAEAGAVVVPHRQGAGAGVERIGRGAGEACRLQTVGGEAGLQQAEDQQEEGVEGGGKRVEGRREEGVWVLERSLCQSEREAATQELKDAGEAAQEPAQPRGGAAQVSSPLGLELGAKTLGRLRCHQILTSAAPAEPMGPHTAALETLGGPTRLNDK